MPADDPAGQTATDEPGVPTRFDGVLLDLLMAVMNSLETWSTAAGDRARGLAWRDAVTARMIATASSYVPYEELVADGARATGLPADAPNELIDRWARMEPWPDAAALGRLALPYGFVTNCSAALAAAAAARSGLAPRFVLSAEEAGRYKPDRRVYEDACRRLGSARQRTLFVAGSPHDAEGARAAGLQSVLVLRRPDHRSAAGTIRTVGSLAEVVAGLAGNSRDTERWW